MFNTIDFHSCYSLSRYFLVCFCWWVLPDTFLAETLGSIHCLFNMQDGQSDISVGQGIFPISTSSSKLWCSFGAQCHSSANFVFWSLYTKGRRAKCAPHHILWISGPMHIRFLIVSAAFVGSFGFQSSPACQLASSLGPQNIFSRSYGSRGLCLPFVCEWMRWFGYVWTISISSMQFKKHSWFSHFLANSIGRYSPQLFFLGRPAWLKELEALDVEVDVCALSSLALALAFVAKRGGNDGMNFGAILAFLTVFSEVTRLQAYSSA